MKERIQLIFICLFVFTLPFYRELNQVFYVLFILASIPLINKELWKERRILIIIFILFYLAQLTACLYAPDKASAFYTLEVQLALLLTPVIFGVSYIDVQKKNKWIICSFISGISIALIYLLICFFIKLYSGGSLGDMLKIEHLNHQYSAPLNIHATYFSTYIVLSVSFLYRFLERSINKFLKLAISLQLALCVISLFLLLSRVVLIVYGLYFLIYFLYQKRNGWIIKFAVLASVVMVIFFFAINSIYFKDRFESELQKDLKLSEWASLFSHSGKSTQEILSINDGSRIERWIAALQLIREHPVAGYGTGQEKPVLYKKYAQLGLTVTLRQKYDAHNQFFSSMLQSGVFGFSSLLLIFIFGFYLSLRNPDPVYFSFILVSLAVCLFDNYLNVNKGIFFFSFFNTFFFISYIENKKIKEAI